MRFNDLKKLFTGPVLVNLDRIITPKLITLFYLTGLAGIGLWGLNHLFFSFRFGLGNGVWGVLEIAIFGTLAFIVLRAVCEMTLMFFETHKDVVAQQAKNRALSTTPNLIEDVREAIEDLARDDAENTARFAVPTPGPTQQTAPTTSVSPPKSTTSKSTPPKPARLRDKVSSTKTVKRAAPRRTAKRSPKTSRT